MRYQQALRQLLQHTTNHRHSSTTSQARSETGKSIQLVLVNAVVRKKRRTLRPLAKAVSTVIVDIVDVVEDAAMAEEDTIVDTEIEDEATIVAAVLHSLPVFLRKLSCNFTSVRESSFQAR
jgi:proteasome lid subunit RPN8/RPN11